MNYKERLDCFLRAYLDTQINEDEEELLPSGSKAISIQIFKEFLESNKGLNKTFFSAFEGIANDKLSIDECKRMGSTLKVVGKEKKLLDDFIIYNYFSSECVIGSLSIRDKISSKEFNLETYAPTLKKQLKR